MRLQFWAVVICVMWQVDNSPNSLVPIRMIHPGTPQQQLTVAMEGGFNMAAVTCVKDRSAPAVEIN